MTVEKPYKDSAGRWWVVLNGHPWQFPTEEEARAFASDPERLRDAESLRRRVESATNDLKRVEASVEMSFKRNGHVKPLQTVPQSPSPEVPTHILYVDPDEAEEAYSHMAEAEIARLEKEQAEQGKIPFTFFIRKYSWIGVILSIGALAAAYIKGC